jgi:hypothetical protein
VKLAHTISKDKKAWKKGLKRAKTYNSRDSPMVTHLTTNPPVSCLNRAERTGSLVLKILWSYVKEEFGAYYYIVAWIPRRRSKCPGGKSKYVLRGTRLLFWLRAAVASYQSTAAIISLEAHASMLVAQNVSTVTSSRQIALARSIYASKV